MARKVSRALYQIRRSIGSRKAEVLVPLYKVFVPPHLEYCVQAWRPYLRKDICLLETIQKRFTRGLLGMRDVPYEDRLAALGLFSLERRRRRGDLIEAFKVIKGFSDVSANANPLMPLRAPKAWRGHSPTLAKERVRCRLRAQTFPVRVVNDWNRLPPGQLGTGLEPVKDFKTSRLPQSALGTTTVGSFEHHLDRV